MSDLLVPARKFTFAIEGLLPPINALSERECKLLLFTCKAICTGMMGMALGPQFVQAVMDGSWESAVSITPYLGPLPGMPPGGKPA